jgi:hypothetical protein
VAGQVAAWLQRADAAVAGVAGAGILLLHWDGFRDGFGVAAPRPLVTVAAVTALAWAPVLAVAAPSRAAAAVSAALAGGAAVALVRAGWPSSTFGEVAVVVLTAQLVLSAFAEAAIAVFAIRSNPTRTRS